MGLALYRKYRPKRLADVVGQDHIITTLKNALKSGKISHAYLFTGPRGVGKTSIARILAHEINQLPYTDDTTHLDIIEIDAASNRRIDEIRDLRDKVHIAPTSAHYKVYIIDEVHMLTREAFNALLKTLEEPPAHVVFILATTEAHKVPDTIISRTQRFTFKPITTDDAVAHLQTLAKEEHIDISTEALRLLSEHANGSFRDSINLLDQMVGLGSVDKKEVEQLLGLPSKQLIQQILHALDSSDVTTLVRQLSEARVSGVDATSLASGLASALRDQVIQSAETPSTERVTLLKHLATATTERDPFTGLELALLGYVSVPEQRTVRIKQVDVPTQVEQAENNTQVPRHTTQKVAAEQVTQTQPSPDKSTPKNTPTAPSSDEASFWQDLLEHIKKTRNTLYGVLRMAQPSLEGSVLTLRFSFGFHQKQVSTAANQKLIADTLQDLLGKPIEIVSIVDKNASPANNQKTSPETTKKAAQSVDTPSPLNTVSSIFNGAELLE